MVESAAQSAVEDEGHTRSSRRRDDETPRRAWPFVDRRSGTDRRLRPTRWHDSLFGHRQRVRGRRRGESRNVYVDLYHAADLIFISLLFLLNLVDAGLTLSHVSSGGIEQNPLMDELMHWGPIYFLLEKFVVVGLCLLAMVVHKTFKLARIGAWILLVFYSLLMVRHISYLV
jgi:hypothetical protein